VVFFVQATRLTLICHARTLAQTLARFPEDEPLAMDWQSARGSRGARFKAASRLLCAPELRTRQTAELFGKPVEIVAALRDCDFGLWRGMRISELQKNQGELLQAWLADPHSAPHGGESVAQVGERVGAWLKTLEASPGHVLAVTHPFIMRAALMQVLQGSASSLIDVEPLATLDLQFHGCWRLRLACSDNEGML
jgi:broad specificity phosphatase PhoE